VDTTTSGCACPWAFYWDASGASPVCTACGTGANTTGVGATASTQCSCPTGYYGTPGGAGIRTGRVPRVLLPFEQTWATCLPVTSATQHHSCSILRGTKNGSAVQVHRAMPSYSRARVSGSHSDWDARQLVRKPYC
jgi:hypothetical protein